jgi:hypothetical protein
MGVGVTNEQGPRHQVTNTNTNLIGRSVCGDTDVGGGGGGGLVDEEVLDVPAEQRLCEVLGDAAVVATVAAGGGRKGSAVSTTL